MVPDWFLELKREQDELLKGEIKSLVYNWCRTNREDYRSGWHRLYKSFCFETGFKLPRKGCKLSSIQIEGLLGDLYAVAARIMMP